MTICVPQRPFVVFGIGCVYVGLFSWIITIPLFVLNLTSKWHVGDPAIELVFGAMAFIFSMWLLKKENKEKHWIEWCKQPKNGDVK